MDSSTTAGDVDARAALALAARAGEFFAVAPYQAGGWRPLRAFVQDPDAVITRVGDARAFLTARTGGEVELRACASVNALGLVSRVVSPALAAAVLAGVVPRLQLDTVGWPPGTGPIALRDPSGPAVDSARDAATALLAHVVGPVVAPVLERYRAQFGLSPHILWGNVASALAGAAIVLRRCGLPLRLDPDDVLAAALAHDPLRGRGRVDDGVFVRTNCCLFYRFPAGAKCADCVLLLRGAADSRGA